MADFAAAESVTIERVNQPLDLVVGLEGEPKADPAALQGGFAALFYPAEAQKDADGEDREGRAEEPIPDPARAEKRQ
jgi:hypothetical protein